MFLANLNHDLNNFNVLVPLTSRGLPFPNEVGLIIKLNSTISLSKCSIKISPFNVNYIL